MGPTGRLCLCITYIYYEHATNERATDALTCICRLLLIPHPLDAEHSQCLKLDGCSRTSFSTN